MRQSTDVHPLHSINFTRDYELFSYLPNSINRKIEPPHTKTLVKSIGLMGPLRVVICAHLHFMSKNKLYVLDGQHLIEASRISNEEIAYVIIPIANKKELVQTIAMLNSSAKNWKTLDYVNSWAWLSHDYKVLLEAFYQHHLPLTAVWCAYSMLDTRAADVIKDGKFKLMDKVNGDKLCDWMDELFEIIPRTNRVATRMFVETYVEMYYTDKKGYKHEAFKEYIQANVRKFFILPDKKKPWVEFLTSYLS